MKLERRRLDVGVSGKSEMYAWAGQNQFNDAGIIGLVKFGPISSGSFTGFLRAVFTRGIATYQRMGHAIRDGRDMVEYSCSVPRESNSYQVRADDSRFIFTAYGGTYDPNPDADGGRWRL